MGRRISVVLRELQHRSIIFKTVLPGNGGGRILQNQDTAAINGDQVHVGDDSELL